VRLLFPQFLPQDILNAFVKLLGFLNPIFECKIPLIERFPLGSQLAFAGRGAFNAVHLRFLCPYCLR